MGSKLYMKKIVTNIAIIATMFAPVALTSSAYAAKPSDNHAGAVKYEWHLSGDVMPVPPYGSLDIPGSDTASKLIVNQPNGKVLANMTGVMKGLLPNTEYTVYLSNVYTPYVFTGWNVAGSWIVDFEYQGSFYSHDMTLAQDAGGDLTGSGGHVAGGPHTYEWSLTSGSVTNTTIDFSAVYTLGAVGTTMHVVGTIAPDGSMSGTWSDDFGGARSGTWSSTSGQAVKTFTGSTGWPGLLTSTVQPFTFTTNSFGSGSWHLNLTGSDISLPTSFSAWINSSGGTILISDPIQLY